MESWKNELREPPSNPFSNGDETPLFSIACDLPEPFPSDCSFSCDVGKGKKKYNLFVCVDEMRKDE